MVMSLRVSGSTLPFTEDAFKPIFSAATSSPYPEIKFTYPKSFEKCVNNLENTVAIRYMRSN